MSRPHNNIMSRSYAYIYIYIQGMPISRSHAYISRSHAYVQITHIHIQITHIQVQITHIRVRITLKHTSPKTTIHIQQKHQVAESYYMSNSKHQIQAPKPSNVAKLLVLPLPLPSPRPPLPLLPLPLPLPGPLALALAHALHVKGVKLCK